MLGNAQKKVLLLDNDPQGNSTSGFGINKDQLKHSVYDVLINEVPIDDCIVDSIVETLKMSFQYSTGGAEVELVSLISRETRLKMALDEMNSEFDYVIIDCPPSLGMPTLNALTAADTVLVPIQCEYYALKA